MKMVRIGFIGCGNHSTHNLYPMLKLARASLEAVCDVDERAGRRNMEIFNAKAWYPHVDQMLDQAALDAVMVVGPPQLHYEAGLKALRRGLPVFTEKPSALTLAKTQELVDTAKAHGTFIMTAFMKRHGLTYARIRETITSGRFVPNSLLMKYMHWPNNELHTMLLYMCSHPLDLAMSFFGFPKRMQSTLGQDRNGWLTLFINLTFDQGRVAQLALGSQARIQEHLEISGFLDGKAAFFAVDNVHHMELHTQGHNGIDDDLGDLQKLQHNFDLQDIQVWRPDYGVPGIGNSQQFSQGYAGEVREFCNAILEKRPANPGMQDSINVMRLIEALMANPDGTTELPQNF